MVSHATTSDVCSVVGVLLSPLFGLLDSFALVVFPVVSDCLVKGIITVRGRHEGLDGEEDLDKKSDILIRKLKQNTIWPKFEYQAIC